MRYNLLKLLCDLEEVGGVILSKDVDLRSLCEICLSKQGENVGRGRGRPRKEVEEASIMRDVKIDRLMAEVSKEETSDEESIEVKKITIEGKDYLISKRKQIYCPESHEEIGSYINNNLVLFEA